MFGLVVLLLIVVPVVELYVLFQVADSFGWLTSIGLLLLISFAGAALMRWQTSGAWARVQNKLQAGEVPSNELIDGALMIFGGALLLTPGFFTDAFGLAMFIPPLRAIARRVVRKRFGKRMTLVGSTGGSMFTMSSGFGPAGFDPRRPAPGDIIDVEDVHVDRNTPDELPPFPE